MIQNNRDLAQFKILYVEDNIEVHEEVIKFLQMYNARSLFSAYNGKEGLSLYLKEKPDIVITDIKMPKMGGIEMVREIRAHDKDIPVIVTTAFGETQHLIDAIEVGVDKYLLKPIQLSELKESIIKALSSKLQEKEIANLKNELKGSYGILLWKSQKMQKIFSYIEQVAKTDASILLQGETGVGKSYIAKIIHNMSMRRAKPFVGVDLGMLPENLIESELFGHIKGSFTGADRDKKGFFETAEGGTIFIDELENIPLKVQIKLLKAVEEKVIYRVGSTTPLKIDVRIMGAINRDITDEMKNRNFREDLYYRLSQFTIKLPPLRERIEDIEPLSQIIANEIAHEYGSVPPELSDDAMKILKTHTWPGNIRELKNVLRRALFLKSGVKITEHDIEASFSHEPANAFKDGSISPNKSKRKLVSVNTDSFNLELIEKTVIKKALEYTGFNRTETASLLGLNYRTLQSKLKKYEIKNTI